MYSNTTTSEYSLQLKEAKRIIKAEQLRKREVFFNKINQKILGIFSIALSITELVLGFNGIIDEGGVFIFMLPMGLYLLFSKKTLL